MSSLSMLFLYALPIDPEPIFMGILVNSLLGFEEMCALSERRLEIKHYILHQVEASDLDVYLFKSFRR